MSSNPCSIQAPLNTPACETLPSQIENFNLNFFGEVFKTEVDGQVQWSLPGRLDVGLPLNPRGVGEPLGCYLLRMFQYGVVGDRGEKGTPGRTACNGNTPYVQVLTGFGQQPKDAVFPILVTRNPSILPGMDVFIEGSGWYEIISSDGLGNVTIALRQTVVNPSPFIPVGTVLLPSGKIGDRGNPGVPGIKGVEGGQGSQGNPGDQGIQGIPAPVENVVLPLQQAKIPQFSVEILNPFPLPGIVDGYEGGFTTAAFVNVILFPGAVPCTVTLPKPGTWLLIARCGFGAVSETHAQGTESISKPGVNNFRMKNISTNTVIPQSTATIHISSLIVAFTSTVSKNNVVQLQAQAVVGAGVVSAHYFWAFRIS